MPMTPNTQAPLRVAIVGAGMAGLSAARVLQGTTSHRVTLFDKARGVGGRTSLRRADPFAFDHGAQYFTARDPIFRAQVDEWMEQGHVAPWQGRMAVIDAPGVVEAQAARATDEDPGGNVERFVGTPGMNAMAKAMATGLEVETRARVHSLEPSETEGIRWRLRFEDGRIEDGFDAVLVTTPPAQAAPLVAHSEELRSAANSVVMRPCWAAMAAFKEPLDLPLDGAFVNTGGLSWVCRNSAKKGRPEGDAWVLHGSAEWTLSHLELTKEEAAAALLREFSSATGAALPKPAHLSAHRWMYSGPETPRTDGHLLDGAQSIGLAGDWLNGSKVQGAWLSGKALAHALLAQ